MNSKHLPSSVASSLNHATVVANLVEQAGGPLAISYPDVSVNAAERFDQALSAYEFEYRIFTAHKATSSTALLQSLKAKTGVDVASSGELLHVLEIGFLPENIIATGPKSRRFLRDLVQHPDITIVVDSENEVDTLVSLGFKNPLLIRITRSILSRSSVVQTSRFGVNGNGLEKIKQCLTNKDQLCGLAFHIDTQSIEEKTHATNILIDMLVQLQAEGYDNATVLDIGGGFGQRLGMDEAMLNAFKATHDVSRVTLPSFPVEADRLNAILSAKNDDVVLADRLRDLLIEVWCEPGAALFNAAGIVAAGIVDVREIDGRWMVVCDIHRNQMTFEDFDTPLDPVLISSNQNSSDFVCDLYGHLCTETDRLYRREIKFDKRPKIGDTIVFTYTGAYRSHFNASQSIGHPLATQYYYHNGIFTKETI